MIIRGTKQTFLDRPLAYYHIGIVEKEGTDFFVLHATKDHGCIRQPLDQFISEEGLIDVYRKSSPLINSLKILKKSQVHVRSTIQSELQIRSARILLFGLLPN